jgi:hypothetical protein
MVKPVLLAAVRAGLFADSVYVPALLTERLLNVATPFCGVAVSVPASPVPPTSATVTGLVAFVTTLPLLSSTKTWTAGVMVAPVCAFEGCTENASFTAVGAGVEMVKLALVAEVKLGLLADSV